MRTVKSKCRLAAFVAATALVTSSFAANMPLPVAEATSSITARDLKKHLSFLASDELGGRYTLSPSNLIAARYLASQLESFGYRGAARGRSFFQKVPLSYRQVDLASSKASINAASINAAGEDQEFAYGEGFLSETPDNANVTADLVFVGYGISSAEHNRDDYADLDVKGKIVVALSASPASLNGGTLDQTELGIDAAAAHGAIAAIFVPEPQMLIAWSELKTMATSQNQLGLPPHPTSSGKALPSVLAGPQLIKALARLMSRDSSYLTSPSEKNVKPQPIAARASIKMRVDVKPAPPAQNVVGILEGSDPKLKDQYVVFSAHYDHLKTSERGEVYNGADDDGSGTASVLEIAQAFSIGPRARRSILIIFHTGEELGLFGSEFNADYEPVVPLSKLVADFNIDMVGRSKPMNDTDPLDAHLTDKNSIYIIGADKLSTELNSLSEQTNADTARMRFDYTYNDEKHPERFYYRSDHYNYAKHGIPIIFYFTGVHSDYHRPTDDVEKIDFDKMERIDRLVFATGWRVANLDHRLVVDKFVKKPIRK